MVCNTAVDNQNIVQAKWLGILFACRQVLDKQWLLVVVLVTELSHCGEPMAVKGEKKPREACYSQVGPGYLQPSPRLGAGSPSPHLWSWKLPIATKVGSLRALHFPLCAPLFP